MGLLEVQSQCGNPRVGSSRFTGSVPVLGLEVRLEGLGFRVEGLGAKL